MVNSINDDAQCLTILLSKSSNDQKIYDEAVAYACQHFTTITFKDDFWHLDSESLRKILSSDDLNVPNEEIVFESMRKWLAINRLNPLDHLESIIMVVRLPLLPIKYLLTEVESFVYEIPSCRKMFLDAVHWHIFPNRKLKVSIRKYQNIPMKKGSYCNTLTSSRKLLSIGSNELKSARSIEVYDEYLEQWTSPKEFAINRRNYAVALIDNQILLIGGTLSADLDTEPVNTVESLDLSTGLIWNVAPLNEDRQFCAAVVVGEGKFAFLYVLGGWGKGKLLKSVERWDTVSRVWNNVTPMTEARTGLGAVVLQNKIYVMGGRIGGNYSKTMEAYDTLSDEWIQKSPMKETNAYFRVTVFKGNIYVVAGNKAYLSPVNTFEKYDPINDSWTTLANVIGTGQVGISSFQNRLICAGGKNSKIVQEYDETNNKWISLEQLHTSRQGYLIELPESMNDYKFDWTTQKLPTQKILSIGNLDFDTAHIFEFYDDRERKWVQQNCPNVKKANYGTAVVDGNLLMIGGSIIAHQPINSVESINLSTGEISYIAPLNVPRFCAPAVVVGDGKLSYVYVFSGWGKNNVLQKSVERWDSLSGAWTFVTPMTVGRTGHAVELLKDEIYVVGGRIGDSYQKTVEAYNIKTDKWTPKASLNKINAYFAIKAFNDCIYVAGGNMYQNPINTVERYDPIQNVWSTIANISSTGVVGLATLGNRLVCAGGLKSNIFEEYDEFHNTWKKLPSMQSAHAGCLIELPTNIQNIPSNWNTQTSPNKLICVGSWNESTTKMVDIFDTKKNTWIATKNLKINKINYGAGIVGNNLMIVGGQDSDKKILNTVECIDLSNGNMTSLPPLKEVRMFCPAVVVQEGDKEYLYVIGGWSLNDNMLKSVEKWDASTNSWTQGTPMTIGLTGHGAAVLDGKIYVMGGRNKNPYLDTMEAYNIKGDIWERKASMIHTNGYFGVAAFRNHLYVVGGSTQYQKPVNTVERYNPIDDSWTTMANIESTKGIGLCSTGNRLICAGGTKTSVQEYDVENNKWNSLPSMKTARHFYLLELPKSMNDYQFNWT